MQKYIISIPKFGKMLLSHWSVNINLINSVFYRMRDRNSHINIFTLQHNISLWHLVTCLASCTLAGLLWYLAWVVVQSCLSDPSPGCSWLLPRRWGLTWGTSWSLSPWSGSAHHLEKYTQKEGWKSEIEIPFRDIFYLNTTNGCVLI